MTSRLKINIFVTLLTFAVFSSVSVHAEPDLGSAKAVTGLNRVWLSVQALVFKSDLSGGRLRKMEERERDKLKTEMQALLNDFLLPQLRIAGISSDQTPIVIEDAWAYFNQATQNKPNTRITRNFLVNLARRSNRKAPDTRTSHLRLFIEIQQDGLRNIGRLELALLEEVSLDRRPGVVFHTIVWQKAIEAVDLGIAINRDTLRASVENLLEFLLADFKAVN